MVPAEAEIGCVQVVDHRVEVLAPRRIARLAGSGDRVLRVTEHLAGRRAVPDLLVRVVRAAPGPLPEHGLSVDQVQPVPRFAADALARDVLERLHRDPGGGARGGQDRGRAEEHPAGYCTSPGLKAGFSITPKTFPNGSFRPQTRIPPPTSWSASKISAPKSTSLATSAPASSAPQ